MTTPGQRTSVRSTRAVRAAPAGAIELWIVLALVGPVGPLPAFASEEVRVLTVEEAVALALEAAPRLRTLDARERATREAERAARAERLPSLDFLASASLHSDVPELSAPTPGGGTQVIFANLPDRYATRVQAGLPIYTGGRLTHGIAAAEGTSAAAGNDRDAGVNDLVLETRVAWWSLLTAIEGERVLTESLVAYDAHLKEVRDRLDTGLAARNDVLAVQVERDRAELDRLQAAHAAEVARADLRRLFGHPDTTRVDPAGPPAAPPATPRDAGALVTRALASRPDRAALVARIGAAEEQIGVARAARLPGARLVAGYTLANPNREVLPLVDDFEATWDVGVFFSLNVADGGRAAAEIARVSAEADAARHALEETDRTIRFEVTRRRLDLETATAATVVSERNVEAAEENLRVSRDRYREGVIPSSELLDAETARLRAGLDRVESLTHVHIAGARLEHAAGGPGGR